MNSGKDSEQVAMVKKTLAPFASVEDCMDDHACAYNVAKKLALDLANELDGNDRCIGCSVWLVTPGEHYPDVDGWLCKACYKACDEVE